MKCPICNSRKGKRLCKIRENSICSLCCAEIRKQDTCLDCNHYREPKPVVSNKYSDLPMFALQRMADDIELQSYANTIESSFCALDRQEKEKLTDPIILRILERLIDHYYFKNAGPPIEDVLVEKGFSFALNVIAKDLPDIPDETISRIISTIYFAAKRRAGENREYLEFIYRYVGIRVDTGARMMKIPKD